MIASSRLYRLTAASMAVLLLLSGSLPLVQHVCAMAVAHRPMEEHPCHGNDDHGQAMAHHDMLDGGPAHLPAQAEQSCAYKMQHQAAPGDCCTVEAAPGIVTQGVASKRSLEPVAVQALVPAAALSLPDGLRSHALFFDTGPPPASVSLHLLHAVLLN